MSQILQDKNAGRAVFKTAPAVFAVEDSYQIMVPVTCETLMWVQVGGQRFFDHANGVLRSATGVHRMTVPRQLLDDACEYTLCWRVVRQRKPYFTESDEEQQAVYTFQPVPHGGARAFLIGDAHNDTLATVAAARQFEAKYGPMDFLFLAGDVPNDGGSLENLYPIYEIAGQITGGHKPVVYAKGNHDLRGVYAEKMEEYCPSVHGRSYFTWQVGDIWGISLDCGEDKPDTHPEYAHTICCHQFRLEETAYLQQVIRDGAHLQADVRHRVVLSHDPFSVKYEPPFNIEEELYRRLCALLKQHIAPQLMVCGHIHGLAVLEPGCPADHLGQPCRVVIGTDPSHDAQGRPHYIGTGFFFTNDGISFVFIDEAGTEHSPDPDLRF